MRKRILAAVFVLVVVSTEALGALPWAPDNDDQRIAPVSIQYSGQIEAAFSPGEGVLELLVKLINSAKREVRVLAYSLSSPEIVDALLSANRRGVDVQVVVDYRNNITEDVSKKSRRSLSKLANAGVTVRTVSAWQTQHSKIIVVDNTHVQTGSFNYSAAAVLKNSENVLVVWDAPDLAAVYLKHWKTRFDRGEPFVMTY